MVALKSSLLPPAQRDLRVAHRTENNLPVLVTDPYENLAINMVSEAAGYMIRHCHPKPSRRPVTKPCVDCGVRNMSYTGNRCRHCMEFPDAVSACIWVFELYPGGDRLSLDELCEAAGFNKATIQNGISDRCPTEALDGLYRVADRYAKFQSWIDDVRKTSPRSATLYDLCLQYTGKSETALKRACQLLIPGSVGDREIARHVDELRRRGYLA